jgi:hypothetical protein
MEEMIAYCGIVCTECPAYVATQNDDQEALKLTAERWSKEYQSEMKPEDIICDGCLPGHTRYCSHCAECEIRACGIARGIVNCAHCDDYGCERLAGFFEFATEAKTKLEEIRAGL